MMNCQIHFCNKRLAMVFILSAQIQVLFDIFCFLGGFFVEVFCQIFFKEIVKKLIRKTMIINIRKLICIICG